MAVELKEEKMDTQVELKLEIDGEGKADVEIGEAFFNHVLVVFAEHGVFDLTLKGSSDLRIDDHHIVEVIARLLGRAFRESIQDRKGIRRIGDQLLMLDDSVVLCTVDVKGQGLCYFDGEFRKEFCGGFSTEMVPHFFRSLATYGMFNIYIKILQGDNDHHKVQAVFKALARALSEAVSIDPRRV
jgi:imidazoleglycerol-phosphate dehydratase